MLVFAQCLGCAIGFLFFSFIVGKFTLSNLKIDDCFCNSILFGFIVLFISYQLIYLPTFLVRGSYRIATYSWIILIGIASVCCVFRLFRSDRITVPSFTAKQWIVVGIVTSAVLCLCLFISIRHPVYGPDFNTYTTAMNNMYYQDRIWIKAGSLDVHHGLNCFFAVMTIPSLLFGIRPYYVSLFMTRSLLIFLLVLVVYRTGKIALGDFDLPISLGALGMVLLVPLFLLLWNSMYQSRFFFYRANEAKAFCQFFLLPLSFSVFLQMFQPNSDRRSLWILQFLVGLSAVAISISSLSAYPFLVLVGSSALLAYDKFQGWKGTCLYSLFCVTPNMLYALFYYLTKHGYFLL